MCIPNASLRALHIMGSITICLGELNPLLPNSTEATSDISVRSSNQIQLVFQWVIIIIEIITQHSEFLLCASIISKCGTYYLIYLHLYLMRQVLQVSIFYRQGISGPERINKLPKVTESVFKLRQCDPELGTLWELIAPADLLSVLSAIFPAVPNLCGRAFKFRSLQELLLPPPAAGSTPVNITEIPWHGLQSFPHSATSNLDLRAVKTILMGLLLRGKLKWSLWGDCRILVPAF